MSAWITLGSAGPALAIDPPADLALGRPATASSVEDQKFGTCANRVCTPDKANDGDVSTRWGSKFNDKEWWQVDLQAVRRVDTLDITWQSAYATRFRIDTSVDGKDFNRAAVVEVHLSAAEAAIVDLTDAYAQTVTFDARDARYVRITGVERATVYGYSLRDVKVLGPPDAQAPVAPGPPFSSSGTPPPTSGPPSANPPPPAPNQPAAPLRALTPPPVVRIKGHLTARGAQIELLSVHATRRVTIRARCRGDGCPARVRTRRGRSVRLSEFSRALHAGAVIEVFITKRGTYGLYTRFRIRRGRAPRRTERCVLPGTMQPRACPAS